MTVIELWIHFQFFSFSFSHTLLLGIDRSIELRVGFAAATCVHDFCCFKFMQTQLQIARMGWYTSGGVWTVWRCNVWLHDGDRNGRIKAVFQNYRIRRWYRKSAIPFPRWIAVPIFGRTIFDVRQIGNQ